ncbi:MAG TPA: hypothetical protein VMT81_01495 [Candidatus Paceibacterota bacterium]|nr:hypothetical protein [Candidatus Paceibacterota bacterium]
MMRLNPALKTTSVILLIFAVAATQFLYDATKAATPAGEGGGLSPEAVRMVDLGFHSTAGSFLWVATMPEILDLFRDRTEYIPDVAYLNAVDPKLSYPYAFSVLTLPAIPTSTGYLTGLADAMAIGQRGLADADPDWRIPYYMATNYYLAYHDMKDAALFFDVAARTPGIPYYAQRFAENFGNEQKDRDRTIALWESIRDTTNDPDTKARAQAYIDHLEIFNYLEAAAAQYRQAYGSFPTDLDQLVAKGIIPAIPADPFGYAFIINQDGTVSINLDATSTPAGNHG